MDPTFHWSIDLGGIITLVVTIAGFIAIITRSRSDLENLKTSMTKLSAEVDDMRIEMAQLKERVANWIGMRMHNPKN